MIAFTMLLLFAQQCAAETIEGGYFAPPHAFIEWDSPSNVDWGMRSIDVNNDGLIDMVQGFDEKNVMYARAWLNNGCKFVDTRTINEANPLKMCHIPVSSANAKEDRQVADALKSAGVAHHVRTFANHRIDYATMTKLTADHLKEMGITAAGDKIRLMELVSSLQIGSKTTPAEMKRELPSEKKQYYRSLRKAKVEKSVQSVSGGAAACSAPNLSGCNFTSPFVFNVASSSDAAPYAQHVDLNNDGLIDVHVSKINGGVDGSTTYYMGTYMNTGSSWCISNENALLRQWRETVGGNYTLHNCTDLK
jgi:hypothetical protein